jgi:hypothetical protein
MVAFLGLSTVHSYATSLFGSIYIYIYIYIYARCLTKKIQNYLIFSYKDVNKWSKVGFDEETEAKTGPFLCLSVCLFSNVGWYY